MAEYAGQLREDGLAVGLCLCLPVQTVSWKTSKMDWLEVKTLEPEAAVVLWSGISRQMVLPLAAVPLQLQDLTRSEVWLSPAYLCCRA